MNFGGSSRQKWRASSLLLCVASLFLAWQASAAQPQLRTIKTTIDPYPVWDYTNSSNAVIIIYKSTSLGSVWSPWKPTSVFPANRTNQNFQVVSGQTYRFMCTAKIDPYGESKPSNTNMLTNVATYEKNTGVISLAFSIGRSRGALQF